MMVIPVVVGAVDATADRLPGWLAQIDTGNDQQGSRFPRL